MATINDIKGGSGLSLGVLLREPLSQSNSMMDGERQRETEREGGNASLPEVILSEIKISYPIKPSNLYYCCLWQVRHEEHAPRSQRMRGRCYLVVI